VVEIDPEPRQRLARGLDEPEVAEVVEQQPPDQELEREVIHPLAALPVGAVGGLDPAVDDVVAHGERGGGVPVVVARARAVLAHRVDELGVDRLAQRGGVGQAPLRPPPARGLARKAAIAAWRGRRKGIATALSTSSILAMGRSCDGWSERRACALLLCAARK
jgi:hypothetical protein